MDFIEIELAIPKKIQHLVEVMEKIEPDSCLAGGFLSDLYMGTPFKDVDLFIQADNHSFTNFVTLLGKECKLTNTKEFDDYYGDSNGIHYVLKATYEEYELNFIFNDHGKNSASHFDLCFREFYYSNGKTFVTKEALADIENKELSVGISLDPCVTMHRMITFQKKYNFSFNPTTLAIINNMFLLHLSMDSNYLQQTLVSAKYEETRLAITAYFVDFLTNHKKVPIKKHSFLHLVYEDTYVKRDEFHAVFFEESCYQAEFTYPIPKNLALNLVKEEFAHLKEEFLKQAMRLSIEDPFFVQEAKEQLDDPYYVIYVLSPKLRAYNHRHHATITNQPFVKLQEILQRIVSISNSISHVGSEFTVIFDQEKAFNDFHFSIAEYLTGRFVFVKIDRLFSAVYDLKTKTFSNPNIPLVAEPYLLDAIAQMTEQINSKKAPH